jgi:hypothetical protein
MLSGVIAPEAYRLIPPKTARNHKNTKKRRENVDFGGATVWTRRLVPRSGRYVAQQAGSASEWVFPSEAAEAGEVGIRGVKSAVVFNGKSGKASVGDEVSRRVASVEHLLENTPVIVGGH